MKPQQYILAVVWICLVVSMIGFTSAEVSSLGTIKQSECIEIPQVCASCTYVNLSVQYPNKSIAISNQAMIPNGAGLWTYNFCNTSQLGRYDVSGQGDLSGTDTGFSVLWFEVTMSGNASPDGFVVVLFIVAFLAVLFYMSFLVINNIGHFAQLDYDLNDLMKNVGAYFVLIGLYFLQLNYMGNPLMDSVLTFLMWIGGFTNVGLSFLAFTFSHLNQVMKQKVRLQDY
jgi:hypothetical protein